MRINQTNVALGLYVIATARRPEVMAELAALGMSTLALDVTDAESIKTCHAEVAKLTGGKLDILVNNACVFMYVWFFLNVC